MQIQQNKSTNREAMANLPMKPDTAPPRAAPLSVAPMRAPHDVWDRDRDDRGRVRDRHEYRERDYRRTGRDTRHSPRPERDRDRSPHYDRWRDGRSERPRYDSPPPRQRRSRSPRRPDHGYERPRRSPPPPPPRHRHRHVDDRRRSRSRHLSRSRSPRRYRSPPRSPPRHDPPRRTETRVIRSGHDNHSRTPHPNPPKEPEKPEKSHIESSPVPPVPATPQPPVTLPQPQPRSPPRGPRAHVGVPTGPSSQFPGPSPTRPDTRPQAKPPPSEQCALPSLPNLPVYRPREHSLRVNKLYMDMSRSQTHRANLMTDYKQDTWDLRRATHELDMAVIDLRAAENRRTLADDQLDRARAGVLGIDAAPMT